MGTQRRIRHKIFGWLRRYAPNEIAGWVGQLGAAAATFELTGSYAAAVIAATIGASAGYYAAAYFNGVRWSYRAPHRRRVRAGRGDRHPKVGVITDALPQTASARDVIRVPLWWMYVVPAS
jgi:hypothetical protein